MKENDIDKTTLKEKMFVNSLYGTTIQEIMNKQYLERRIVIYPSYRTGEEIEEINEILSRPYSTFFDDRKRDDGGINPSTIVRSLKDLLNHQYYTDEKGKIRNRRVKVIVEDRERSIHWEITFSVYLMHSTIQYSITNLYTRQEVVVYPIFFSSQQLFDEIMRRGILRFAEIVLFIESSRKEVKE